MRSRRLAPLALPAIEMPKNGARKQQSLAASSIPASVRRAVNEAAVRSFFSASDPAWRWVLILGLRDLRANAGHLGRLAAAESPSGTGWSDESYAYGPIVHGLTAAAVNECAQHCEDLFATLRFLRERFDFAKRMLSYNAGTVTRFGVKLRDVEEEEVRRLFLIPPQSIVEQGLKRSADPAGSLSLHLAALARLVERVRLVSNWYTTYEDFHVQYKHGLKLAMRPYGNPTQDAIQKRRSNVTGALLAFTSEPVSNMLKGPQHQQAMIFPNLIPEARAHLNALVADRALLRYKMSGPEVDLNEVAAVSGTVTQLLSIAAANRLAVAAAVDHHDIYKFELPGEKQYETVTVVLELATAPTLDDY
jgi:hypothetical protein